MPIIGTGPYDGYVVYGPYWHKKEKRFMTILVNGDKRTSTSNARYVMAMHLGHLVPNDKEVDHIDGDRTNDTIENLQLLNKFLNAIKAAKPSTTMVDLVCPWCEKTFNRRRGQTHLVKGGNPTFCSVKCARAKQFSK